MKGGSRENTSQLKNKNAPVSARSAARRQRHIDGVALAAPRAVFRQVARPQRVIAVLVHANHQHALVGFKHMLRTVSVMYIVIHYGYARQAEGLKRVRSRHRNVIEDAKA